MYVCIQVCTYVRTYVRIYIRMYVCMFVCMYIYICSVWYNMLQPRTQIVIMFYPSIVCYFCYYWWTKVGIQRNHHFYGCCSSIVHYQYIVIWNVSKCIIPTNNKLEPPTNIWDEVSIGFMYRKLWECNQHWIHHRVQAQLDVDLAVTCCHQVFRHC